MAEMVSRSCAIAADAFGVAVVAARAGELVEPAPHEAQKRSSNAKPTRDCGRCERLLNSGCVIGLEI